jgi:hypothetical protein
MEVGDPSALAPALVRAARGRGCTAGHACGAIQATGAQHPGAASRAPAPSAQIIEKVLELCNSQQLGMLSTSCSYFTKSGIIDRFAQQKLKDISRAKGMRPHSA